VSRRHAGWPVTTGKAQLLRTRNGIDVKNRFGRMIEI